MGAPLTPETSDRRGRASLAESWRRVRLALIALLLAAGTAAILLVPILPNRSPYNLQPGNIAPEDIRAPRQISYVSQLEMEAAREAARKNVADIYDTADARIARQQVRRARQVMEFVQNVRADTYADNAQKRQYLDAISGLTVPSDARADLLTVSDAQFELLEREVVTLIEDAMSGPVREGRVEEVTNRLELRVSTDLPENLIPLAVSIARDLVVANSRFNEAATEEARAEAEAAVPEIRHTFEAGEVVIRAGDQVDEFDQEALVALGLATRQLTWRDSASAIVASVLSVTVLIVYLIAFRPVWALRSNHLLVFVILFLIFLAAAQIMIPNRNVAAYLFPAAALSMTLAAMMGVEFAALGTVVLAGLAGFLADESLEITLFTALTGLIAAGTLRRGARLSSYFLSGMFAAVAGMAVLVAFRLPDQAEAARLAQLLLMALLNGLLSAGAALVILFVAGNLTGITTSIQLLDLMRPDHPLQRRMQREALGSYQHTLSVANLVEAAAEAIGADTLLARVGTLYHDVGKASNPGFFVENRIEGQGNPHETLAPLASTRLIKAHVYDGIRLAKKHRLPPQVAAFIPEHHGTTPIAFFLNMAREQAAATNTRLDESEFYYEGPTPQSRESAILMLADGCESAVRANRPATVDEMEQIVTRIIQQRIDQHQLDNSGLTLTDIKTIKDSFVRTLKGMYHPRVKYPGDEKPALPDPANVPALPSESLVPPVMGDSTAADQSQTEAGSDSLFSAPPNS